MTTVYKIGPTTNAARKSNPGKKNFNGMEILVRYVIAIAIKDKSKKNPISYSFFVNAL